MTPEESRMFMQFLAVRVKEYYRDSLTLQAVGQYLRSEGVDALDGVIADFHQSPEYLDAVAEWDRAIDERVPPSDSALFDQTLVKLIEAHGLNRGKPN